MCAILCLLATLLAGCAACPNDGKIRTILWTAPRSGSSVFARSMMQRKDTQVYFERFFDAHYLGPENRSANYYFEPDGVDIRTRTFQAIYTELLSELPATTKHMFAKEMAYYIVPASITEQKDWKVPPDFDCFQHTFLLRTPSAQVPSMVKVQRDEVAMMERTLLEAGESRLDIPLPAVMDFDEIGVQQLHFLFHLIANRTGNKPVTVDIDDLWENPEGVLGAYCQQIGVDFDLTMLRWDKVWREEFRFWDSSTEWMRDVLNSSGFHKQGSTQRQRGSTQSLKASMNLDSPTMEAIAAAQPLYEDMYGARIIV